MIKELKIIDLYSGVGGLSLGGVKAGFNLVGAVEHEKRIIDSHAVNFPKSNHLCTDISSLNGKDLSKKIKIKAIDIAGIVGGPPCQGFSTMGKRSVTDERNLLFNKFFQIVSEINPAFFIAENVPGILDEKYLKIRKKAFGIVESNFDMLAPIKVSANDFGAATTRTRIFFIGIRKDITGGDLISDSLEKMKSKKLTFVKDALKGLPDKIDESWLDFASSWQKLDSLSPNSYTKYINEMVEGIGDLKAIKRFLNKKEVSGCFGTRHTKVVATRYKNLNPGEQDFISKSQKLKNNGFCPTLRAGTDSSKGSFQAVRPIHPLESRVITPREAARLQGFPDWFQFHETKWHSFRQIGNSVCPIVSEKVFLAVRNSLKL
ncbi:MAG: DNA cytosine methyltransferase [Ferruginibacter sp.]